MNASLELLLELGPAAVEQHIEQLVSHVVDWARAERGVRLVTPADPRCRAGIAALLLQDPDAASQRLRRARITHSLREGAIRLSPHCYNTLRKMDRTLAILVGRRGG